MNKLNNDNEPHLDHVTYNWVLLQAVSNCNLRIVSCYLSTFNCDKMDEDDFLTPGR